MSEGDSHNGLMVCCRWLLGSCCERATEDSGLRNYVLGFNWALVWAVRESSSRRSGPGSLHTSKAERKSSRRTQHTLTVGHTHCAIMSISYHGLTPCERGPGGSSVLGGLRHATSSPVTASAEDAAASSAAPHRPWPAAYTSLHEERRLGRPLRHAIVRVCPATILVRVRQVLVCGREPRTTWL